MFRYKCFLLLCFLMPCSLLAQLEICDNGIDDDNDGLIDINDDDCTCTLTKFLSLIPNPSFEDLDCCPSDKAQLNCATDWIQASTPTSDLVHLCDWDGVPEYPPPRPFPDGEGVLGFRDGRLSSNDTLDALWKEYAGACLLSPMQPDSAYRFEFDVGFYSPQISPPINVSLFGTSSCSNLPFAVSAPAFGCPSNNPNWIRLGDVMVSGGAGDRWVGAFIDVVPDRSIEAIAIGPDCDPVANSQIIYYYLDDLQLTDLSAFDFRISEIMHPCDIGFTLSIPANEDFEYQWYLNGIALSGEISSDLSMNYGEGNYQVRILAGTQCRLSTPYDYIIPVFNTADTVRVCQGETYQFGTFELDISGPYQSTFQSINGCDSIVALELEVVGQESDTVEVIIAPGETFVFGDDSFSEEGEYPVTIPSSLGCDSLLLINLLQFNVYIPNVFSPNNDGVNDTFFPLAESEDVTSYSMTIYDRWGTIIYQGDSWDGADSSQNIYVYEIQVAFVNGESSLFYGEVALVK